MGGFYTEHTFYELLWYFFIYAFLGWICEVAYAALRTGKFVNRGFLLGPVCPIYGIGVVAVLCLLEPMRDRPFAVFILSVLITSSVELAVGALCEKLMHERLWDYSKRFLNIGGYVCLLFSLMWGIGCTAIIYLLQPLIAVSVEKMPLAVGISALCVLSAVILTDTFVTGSEALKIDSRMKAISEAGKQLENISDYIGKGVFDGTVYLKDKAENSEVLKKRYEELLNRKSVVHDHMFRAFDRLKSGRYKYAYDKLAEAQKLFKLKKINRKQK